MTTGGEGWFCALPLEAECAVLRLNEPDRVTRSITMVEVLKTYSYLAYEWYYLYIDLHFLKSRMKSGLYHRHRRT